MSYGYIKLNATEAIKSASVMCVDWAPPSSCFVVVSTYGSAVVLSYATELPVLGMAVDVVCSSVVLGVAVDAACVVDVVGTSVVVGRLVLVVVEGSSVVVVVVVVVGGATVVVG